ncbi:MAG: hypothetical protein JXB88_25765, partial [Spirochaetales bacterium]|nr:hypothetical protein [Spirochaetales bacterium]
AYNGIIVELKAIKHLGDNEIAQILNYLKEHGIKEYIEKQKQRMTFLKMMLEKYNEGRSKSFFCLACTLLSCDALQKSLDKADKAIRENEKADIKARATLLKDILKHVAEEENVELRLKRK